MGEEFKSFFDTRSIEGDRPRKIPNIGMTYRLRGSSRKKMVGLEVVKACRVVAKLIIKEVMLDKWLDSRREKVRKKV